MDDETKAAIESASMRLEAVLQETTKKLDELYAVSYQMFDVQRSIYSAWSQAALRAMQQNRDDGNGR